MYVCVILSTEALPFVNLRNLNFFKSNFEKYFYLE